MICRVRKGRRNFIASNSSGRCAHRRDFSSSVQKFDHDDCYRENCQHTCEAHVPKKSNALPSDVTYHCGLPVALLILSAP